MPGVVSSSRIDARPPQRVGELGGVIQRGIGLAISVAGLAFHLSTSGTLPSAAVALALTTLGGAIVAWRSDRGVGGAAFVYILVFGLFHGGLVVAVVIGGEQLLVGQGVNAWVASGRITAAVTAVCITMIAWEVGVLASRPGRVEAAESPSAVTRSRTGVVGLAAVVVGLTLIAAALQPEGGFAALLTGYLEFLEKVADDGAFGYGVAILGCGIGFLVASGGPARVMGLIIVGVVAVVGLPLGLRGTVLFLLATVLVVEAKRRHISAWLFGLGSLAVLTLVSVLRTTRVGGFSALITEGLAAGAPLEAVAEMGYSLYPVVVVQQWLEGGLEYRHGATFIAPILRFLEPFFGTDPGPATDDLRIFNVEVLLRQGPIGGSPVAEGLRNGGIVGACLLMFTIGYVIGRIDRLPATADAGAVTVVVFLPLIIAIRNSFAPVLVQIAIGVIMLITARALGRLSPERGSP